MGSELGQEPGRFCVPGVKQLPLAVEVSAIEETPSIKALDAGIDAADYERRVLEICLITAWLWICLLYTSCIQGSFFLLLHWH